MRGMMSSIIRYLLTREHLCGGPSFAGLLMS